MDNSVLMMAAAALIICSINQGTVYCDGEEGSGETTGVPMENDQQQANDNPPSVESPGYEATPPTEEGNPPGDPMATASSENHPQVSTDQNGNTGAGNQPPTMGDDQQTSGGDGDAGTTINYEIPSEEPDKFGEELLAACKAESNYQGDFSDPNESSRELKCFYACALVRMDVMVEEEGRINFSEQVADEIVAEALGDHTEMIEKYKSAITACNQEVPKDGDRCEYAYAFITCGIQKLSE